MRTSSLVTVILCGAVLALEREGSAAAAGPARRVTKQEKPQEVTEVRTGGFGLAGGPRGDTPEGGQSQLTNPANRTTCTIRVWRGRIDADERTLPLFSDIDPGIVRSISPCVPERPTFGLPVGRNGP